LISWTNIYETCYVYHGIWAHLNGMLKNPSHQSVYLYPTIVARQQLGKHVPASTNARNNIRIVRRVVFYTARVVLKENLWPCLLYRRIVARQRFGKHIPATTKNCWRRRFLCGPCRIEGNLFLLFTFFSSFIAYFCLSFLLWFFCSSFYCLFHPLIKYMEIFSNVFNGPCQLHRFSSTELSGDKRPDVYTWEMFEVTAMYSLRSLWSWDHGLESYRRHGFLVCVCVYSVFLLSCV
jgi:hypothetical protein